ncbi:hypothetical protein ACHAXM_009614 [Skeletonema potamos]
MARFRTPFHGTNYVVGNKKGLQRSKPKQRHILQSMYCVFVSLVVVYISLTQRLHSQSQQHWQFIRIRSKEKRKTNRLPLLSDERTLYNQIRRKSSNNISGANPLTTTSYTTRKPRIVAITSLQYVIPSKSDLDPRPVLVPNSKLLALDTTPLATNTASFHFTESSMPTSGHSIKPSWYTPNALDFLWGRERCEVMYPWQLEGFPNCNNFHELDMAHMKKINTGGSRIAFEVNQYLDGAMQSKFVYKTVKYNIDVDTYTIDQQRKDALVLERATRSIFIPNIYGYCSAGVMMDYAPEGDMNAYVKGARLAKKKGGNESLSPVDRLRVAIHIVSGVRDLHETGDVKEIPAFYHNDICCHQFLFQNGIFKLNDFNYAQPMTFTKNNKTENEICLHEMTGMSMWKHRSFEQHLMDAKDARLEPFSGDKTDINMMGNLMYTILTDLYLFEKPELLTTEEATKALVAGKRSPYPEDIEKSADPAHVAVKKAIEMCWIEKWNQRPSARSVADYLMGQLRNITKEEHPDLRVTLPRRDPYQTNTDSDFDENANN